MPEHPRRSRPTAVPSRRRTAGAGLLLASCLATVGISQAGCSSGPSDPNASTSTAPVRAKGEALNSDDQQRLALSLFRNHQKGGANLVADVDYSADISVTLKGSIDWKDHEGTMEVETVSADGSPPINEQVVFQADAVYTEAQPGQVAEARALGMPGVKWVRRTPDPRRPVDQLIQILVGLAATRPENPELLGQRDLTFDREATVGDVPALVYRSEVAEYWVAKDSGLLLRFVGRPEGFKGEAAFTFSSHGGVSVRIPKPAEVIDSDRLAAS